MEQKPCWIFIQKVYSRVLFGIVYSDYLLIICAQRPRQNNCWDSLVRSLLELFLRIIARRIAGIIAGNSSGYSYCWIKPNLLKLNMLNNITIPVSDWIYVLQAIALVELKLIQPIE